MLCEKSSVYCNCSFNRTTAWDDFFPIMYQKPVILKVILAPTLQIYFSISIGNAKKNQQVLNDFCQKKHDSLHKNFLAIYKQSHFESSRLWFAMATDILHHKTKQIAKQWFITSGNYCTITPFKHIASMFKKSYARLYLK